MSFEPSVVARSAHASRVDHPVWVAHWGLVRSWYKFVSTPYLLGMLIPPFAMARRAHTTLLALHYARTLAALLEW
jgi:hypothetical protein